MALDRFEWDQTKAESNARRHRIAFDDAIRIFLDPDRIVIDVTREADGETRSKAIGRIGTRLFSVVFTMRSGVCRIISARRANSMEQRHYDGDR